MRRLVPLMTRIIHRLLSSAAGSAAGSPPPRPPPARRKSNCCGNSSSPPAAGGLQRSAAGRRRRPAGRRRSLQHAAGSSLSATAARLGGAAPGGPVRCRGRGARRASPSARASPVMTLTRERGGVLLRPAGAGPPGRLQRQRRTGPGRGLPRTSLQPPVPVSAYLRASRASTSSRLVPCGPLHAQVAARELPELQHRRRRRRAVYGLPAALHGRGA